MGEFYPINFERHEDDDDDKKETKSSKKKSRSAISTLGGLTAEKIVTAEGFEQTKKEAEPSLWQKLVETPKETEPKPKGTDKKVETNKNTPEVPLEELSSEEHLEAVRQYADARLEQVREEAGKEDKSEADEAADAADVALLENIKEQLTEEPDKPLEEVLDEAEAAVAGALESEDEHPESDGEEVAKPEVPVSPEEEPADEDDTTLILHPASPAGSPPSGAGSGSGGSGGTPPPRTPHPGSPSPSSGGPSGPGGPAGGGVSSAGFAAARFNQAPAATAYTAEQAFADERLALARGLIVGAVVGYFFGRRRGRIKTERRLLPIQKKLEKQVDDLTAAVAAKELAVRKLAAEKVVRSPKAGPERTFIDRIANPPRTPSNKNPEVTAKPSAQRPAAERLGRVLVEAPAVAIGAAAAARVEQRRAETSIDFSKPVKDYTTAELSRAAEKIRIDGTSLKEISNAHNLNEQSVQRIVRAFVEGRSVRQELNKELLEHEVRYERDPRLRYTQAGQGGGPSAAVAAVAGSAVLAHDGATADPAASASSETRRPVPDQKTLQQIRKQQVTQVTVTALVLIALLAVVLVALIR